MFDDYTSASFLSRFLSSKTQMMLKSVAYTKISTVCLLNCVTNTMVTVTSQKFKQTTVFQVDYVKL